jgi:hypothetical protein
MNNVTPDAPDALAQMSFILPLPDEEGNIWVVFNLKRLKKPSTTTAQAGWVVKT